MKKEYIMVALGLLIGSILGSMMLYFVPAGTDQILYYNQVGLYSSEDNVNQAGTQLEAAGFEHYVVHKGDQYFLLANFSFDQNENNEMTAKLQEAGFSVVAKEVHCPSSLSIEDTAGLIEYLERE